MRRARGFGSGHAKQPQHGLGELVDGGFVTRSGCRWHIRSSPSRPPVTALSAIPAWERDPELTLAIVAGAQLCLGQLPHNQPDRDDAQAADQIAEDLLRMLGVRADEAHKICQRPLPAPGDLPAAAKARLSRA